MTQEHVLYRKYRPSTFDQVVGQSDIVQALSVAAQSKTPLHAYLFSGGRGTGKTSIARIFSHALGIDDVDIYEMDAASNNGVDHVRELRQAVHTLPLSSPYKVYILDEAHMMTPPAFNALLKVLEEPPQHVIFILATTELEKIPETIRSRCQIHIFQRPSLEVLQSVVVDIANREGVKFEDDAIAAIARVGDGSFRDTLGALQKVISVAGSDGMVTHAEVLRILGRIGDDRVRSFLSAVIEKSPDAFTLISAFSTAQAEDLVVSLADYVRQALVLRYQPGTDLNGADPVFLQMLATSPRVTSAFLAELLDLHAALRRATMPTLQLYVFVARQLELK